jgi:acetyl esterase/lipase
MMSTRLIEFESPFGVIVQNRFEVHEPDSDRLMILLPGRGYTVNHPVLFHIRLMAYAQGYDTLPVQYGFHISGNLEPSQIPLLQQDVERATQQVLSRNYREVCVVGKSLGTPLAIDLAKSLKAETVSQILLTPIGVALQDAGDNRTLAVIGTADPLYTPEIAQQGGDHITWRVFENLDHGLIDAGDWRYSVESLKEILSECETFLESGD